MALSDHPINPQRGWVDRFNFAFQLGAVYDIIRHPDTETPLAIGIYGDWGTGKTSAMKWLQGLLDTWNRKSQGDHIRTLPVWFYPWKYQTREDVWRGIVAEIVLATMTVKAASPERVLFAVKRFGAFLGRSFVRALASIKLKGKDPTGILGEGEITFQSVEKILEDFQDLNHPERAYLNRFESMLSNWIIQSVGTDERLVVFIDDLDRCLPDVTLEVLEAIKLYLNIPQLIFVVGLDRTVVESIVLDHYVKRGVDAEKGKDYLAKMFQVEVHLFRMQRAVEEFIDDQLDTFDLWKSSIDRKDLPVFKKFFVRYSGDSPREVKRVINAAMIAARGWMTFSMGDSQQKLTFGEGLVRHFVRLRLRELGRESVLSSDRGNDFLAVWSRAESKLPFAETSILPDQVSASGTILGNLDSSEFPSEYRDIWNRFPELLELLKDELLGELLGTRQFRTSKDLVLQETRAGNLDERSRERLLVGEVTSFVSSAGQICREFAGDRGLDMEVEFIGEDGRATGERVYLVLKSGDSHLRAHRGGKEAFMTPNAELLKYWMAQAFPIMLIIGTSDGTIRWMEIRNRLKDVTNNGEKHVKLIVFEGQEFGTKVVRRWRSAALRTRA